jgi:hypothetical protein
MIATLQQPTNVIVASGTPIQTPNDAFALVWS